MKRIIAGTVIVLDGPCPTFQTRSKMIQPPTIIVWGIAAGVHSTTEAAPGAFTWREYKCSKVEIPVNDWRTIISIKEE